MGAGNALSGISILSSQLAIFRFMIPAIAARVMSAFALLYFSRIKLYRSAWLTL